MTRADPHSCLLSLLLLLLCFLSSPSQAVHTVPALNVTAYLGRWYQVYANSVVMNSFERKACCVYADYHRVLAEQIDHMFWVTNTESRNSPSGPVWRIHGMAVQPRPAEPGRLDVAFIGAPPGTYWVIMLGPRTYGPNCLYEFSVVTDAASQTLFILARNVAKFKTLFEEEVLKFVSDVGFTGDRKQPIETIQEGCTYTASPSDSDDESDDGYEQDEESEEAEDEEEGPFPVLSPDDDSIITAVKRVLHHPLLRH